jgi:hypothetical protein
MAWPPRNCVPQRGLRIEPPAYSNGQVLFEAWAEQQDNKPSLSGAIRRMVEQVLAAAPKRAGAEARQCDSERITPTPYGPHCHL